MILPRSRRIMKGVTPQEEGDNRNPDRAPPSEWHSVDGVSRIP